MAGKLSPAIRALIIDMDGVLWRDKEALVDLPALFADVRGRGLAVVLATNNATRLPGEVIEKLEGFGVQISLDEVITSSMAVTSILKDRFPQGGPVFVVGEPSLRTALEQSGFFQAEENVLAVVAGLDRTLSYEKLCRASLLIRAGALFYGTNADATYPTPEGLVPGAGSVLAAIETASGTKPVIAGKPEPVMYWMALKTLGLSPLETLAVGDRLDTDILGGQRAGCRTGLVLSGVSTQEELDAWSLKPDLVASDIAELLKML